MAVEGMIDHGIEGQNSSWNCKVFQSRLQISGRTIVCLAFLMAFCLAAILSKTFQNTTTFDLIDEVDNHKSKLVAGSIAPNGTNVTASSVVRSAAQNGTNVINSSVDYSRNDSPAQVLDPIFAPGMDKSSCLSRYESVLYQKLSPYKPSPYLLSKLRNYENLHGRCGPNTESYNKSVEQLKSGIKTSPNCNDCNYIVYMSHSGLGNRMLTVASTFLYALLTDRVLLVQFGDDTSHLFCEPFPSSTWLLPSNFPLLNQLFGINQRSPKNFGNLLKNMSALPMPPLLHVYLAFDIGPHDGLFYCDENQALLRQSPWLVLTSNEYFVPALFTMSSFRQELGRLFPEKETVFHHLGRYLFRPSNEAWGLITRFYNAYLATADKKIGLQIRVLDAKSSPAKAVVNQILSCTLKNKILPHLQQKPVFTSSSSSNNITSKAVLITSLYSEYYEQLKKMYWAKPTSTGEVIGFYQPSHEEYQQWNSKHSMKAWAEMYLLSMSDVVVTTSWSTFGYVAQGLGGLKPWILEMPVNGTMRKCVRAMSMEPCFHFPPRFDCKAKGRFDRGDGVFPHVKHCEDVQWGLKLVNDGD